MEKLLPWNEVISTGPDANEAQMSRIISHSSDRGQGQFRWTKRRKQKALQWHDDPRFSIELTVSKLGCKAKDAQMMLCQWAANCETIEKNKRIVNLNGF
jgi:hypothetical protein